MPLTLMATLWPSFPHFPRFAQDNRLAAIRLNSAMINNAQLEEEIDLAFKPEVTVPLYFDVKGRQLRVEEVHLNNKYLDLTLNHPIKVETPTMVLFKAGEDRALLKEVTEDGRRLIFDGGPDYMVYAGESLHIRHPSLEVFGSVFTESEKAKIVRVYEAGFRKYFLSYVQEQRDIDEFLELVGNDVEMMLKIENKQGLAFVANGFKKKENLKLVAARGDMYIEIDRPHQIMAALRLIIEKDPLACVGSRMLLSIVHEPVPSCADLLDLAWLYDLGYRSMMLCDELCLKEELLAPAINVWQSFKDEYVKE